MSGATTLATSISSAQGNITHIRNGWVSMTVCGPAGSIIKNVCQLQRKGLIFILLNVFVPSLITNLLSGKGTIQTEAL